MFKTFLCILCLVFPLQITGFSQSPGRDTTFLKQAITASITLYHDAIQGQAGLYNGSQYLEPPRTNDKHPFFFTDDWVFGSIDYDGEVYDNVPLLYDITSDKVVTELYYNSNPIVLVSQKITWFSASGHTFERIQKEVVNNSIPHTGFYDVIYTGKTKVIVRRQKNVQERIEANKLEKDFEEKNRYYVFKEGKFHQVSNKKSLLKILADEKPTLKQFIRVQKLRFKENRDLALSGLAKYYDSLTHTP